MKRALSADGAPATRSRAGFATAQLTQLTQLTHRRGVLVYLGIEGVADRRSFLARPLRVDSCEPGTIGGIGGAIETVLFATSEKVPVSRY